MVADQGWLKLYRKIDESIVWTDANQLKLWLLLLIKANHEDKKFLFNGQEISVTSGQVVTGAHALAFEFNKGVTHDNQVSWRQLWRLVKRFEKWQMLTIKSTTKYSVITILNWGAYQSNDNQVSINRQSNVNQVSTNKNLKNDKNEKNKDIYSQAIEYLNQKTKKNYKSTTQSNRTLIHARTKEGYSLADFKTVIDKKVAEWQGTDMEQYLRPGTLFSTKFEGYLNQPATSNRSGNRYRPETVGEYLQPIDEDELPF